MCVAEYERSVPLLMFHFRSQRRLEGFLWDYESANNVCGCLHDIDVHCISACWIDQLAKGRSVYESQSPDGACGSEHSFEYSGYPTGGLSYPISLSGLFVEALCRR